MNELDGAAERVRRVRASRTGSGPAFRAMLMDIYKEETADDAEDAFGRDEAALADAYLAAHPAADAEPDGWRPIETAPKDGTAILLGGPGWRCCGYYCNAPEGYRGVEGWYEDNTHWTDNTCGRVQPTHWQPLPAPPKPGKPAKG